MSVETRLTSLEKEVVRLTASVAKLDASSVSTKDLTPIQNDITELKTYFIIAGAGSAIILTALCSIIIYLIVK